MTYGLEDDEPTWADQVTPPADLPGPRQPRSMRGQPPGWFADPLSPTTHQRWWTGQGWSGHTQPPQGPELPAVVSGSERVPVSGQSAVPGSRRISRRVVAGAFGVLALLAGAVVTAALVSPGRVGGPAGPDLPAPSATRPTSAAAGAAAGAPWAVLVGVPGEASLTCAATPGEGQPGDVPGQRTLRCTFTAPGSAGTVVCIGDAGQSHPGTRCTTHDEATQSSSSSVCLWSGAQMACRPTAPDRSSR